MWGIVWSGFRSAVEVGLRLPAHACGMMEPDPPRQRNDPAGGDQEDLVALNDPWARARPQGPPTVFGPAVVESGASDQRPIPPATHYVQVPGQCEASQGTLPTVGASGTLGSDRSWQCVVSETLRLESVATHSWQPHSSYVASAPPPGFDGNDALGWMGSCRSATTPASFGGCGPGVHLPHPPCFPGGCCGPPGGVGPCHCGPHGFPVGGFPCGVFGIPPSAWPYHMMNPMNMTSPPPMTWGNGPYQASPPPPSGHEDR